VNILPTHTDVGSGADEGINYGDIGARLNAFRMGRNIPPEVLAEKLGISRAALYRVEKGEIRKLDTLTSIARVLGISLPNLLGVGVEYVDNAVTFFERMRQLEQDSEQIIGLFGPVSYLLTSDDYDEMLRQVFQDLEAGSGEGDGETSQQIARLLDILRQRKEAFRKRRQLLVSLFTSADLERFLRHGVVAGGAMPNALQQDRRAMACREARHISAMLRKQPIGVQMGIILQSTPATGFQVFRQPSRSVVAISPFRLGEQPNVHVGVGMITSAPEALSLHEEIARKLWTKSLKGADAADYLDGMIENFCEA
jgi:transcriptional regulator with XRE-family HTH domain